MNMSKYTYMCSILNIQIPSNTDGRRYYFYLAWTSGDNISERAAPVVHGFYKKCKHLYLFFGFGRPLRSQSSGKHSSAGIYSDRHVVCVGMKVIYTSAR